MLKAENNVPFTFRKLDIPDVILVEPRVFPDDRGFFLELYKHSDFLSSGIPDHFVQDNYSSSSKGTLRGLHYQKTPHSQGKMVRCIKGEIYDIAVDLRKGSPTYGKWVGQILSEENFLMLYIPEGFAHGFLVTSDTADVLYKCTAEYSPEYDRGILWSDKDIGITWPITDPLLSGKDSELPLLKEADINFLYSKRS